MNVILLGAPGSGKGTMAEVLVKEQHLVHIATGDIFRYNIKEQTTLGKEAKSYIEKGLLVPDAVTIKMVKDRLSQADVKQGFLLDGFPRSLIQAEALSEMLKELGLDLDFVLAIDVPEEQIVERLAGRRVCLDCGASYHIVSKKPQKDAVCDNCQADVVQRADDKEETVLKRLHTYHEQTQPLLNYYEPLGLIRHLDNSADYQTSYANLRKIISEFA